MKARVISLVCGLVTILVALSFQVITACSGVNNMHNRGSMSAINISGMKHMLMVKATVASFVISVISFLVLLTDRYLDKHTLKK